MCTPEDTILDGHCQRGSTKKPLVSIVVPALNEEITIQRFVEWCKEGLEKAGVSGEILIVDSSTDSTGDVAEAAGARVLRVPHRGLGQAYIDAIPRARGKYLILGDCDCTYDFREIKPFIEKLEEGFEFVMGSRFAGYIEPGSMPALHRYFGTPLTTFILNFIYGSSYSDIHCGMRALTVEAWEKIQLESGSWEYASEMTLKAALLGLRTTEVPIRFYKEPEGRLSHHKRQGWMSPWAAGWSNLKAMFLYRPQFFLKVPGVAIVLAGVALLVASLWGGQSVGPVTLAVHSSLLAITLVIFGNGALQLGVVAKVFHNFEPAATERLERLFSYDRGLIISFVLGLTGLALVGFFVRGYISEGYRLSETSRPAVLGLLGLILAFQHFSFTLVLNMISERRRNRERIEQIAAADD